MIAPGDVLQNRYRIERSIGRGGMGEVFAAVVLLPVPGKEHDIEATLLPASPESARVAIKVVSRAIVSEAAMARLLREARAASRIRSAFVPELVEVGATPDGELFLVMELLYGETLSDRLKARAWLSWDEVFRLGDDVLTGLIDAHDAGVVHRDLKPSNIFLCAPAPDAPDERAKVLDFGVCKLDTPDEDKLTATGEAVGTASYMAPEQIRGASHVTERADLYSFATVVFEALSGELPHSGAGQMAMIASKLERRARRLSEVARTPVPEGLEALLMRLLTRDASARIASATEVREAWRALGPATVAPRLANALAERDASEPAPPMTGAGLSSGTLRVPDRPHSRLGIAMASLAVIVSGVALFRLARPLDSPVAAADDAGAVPRSMTQPLTPPRASSVRLVASAALDRPDAGGWVSENTVRPPVPPPGTPVRPPPGASHPPTKPHIEGKPRY